MLAPPHSLHMLLSRWCWQMLASPHSLHVLLSRWCGQMLVPPQSLHLVHLLSLHLLHLTSLARTRCVSRQTISRRMSASGSVASVAFPPCPNHFLIAHKIAALSHSSKTSSLRAADCNASTTPPNSGLFEIVPSSSLPTRAHLSATSPGICSTLTPSFHLLHDQSAPIIAP